MLADILAHRLADTGAPTEEFEDEDFDVDAVLESLAATDGEWEDLINA